MGGRKKEREREREREREKSEATRWRRRGQNRQYDRSFWVRDKEKHAFGTGGLVAAIVTKKAKQWTSGWAMNPPDQQGKYNLNAGTEKEEGKHAWQSWHHVLDKLDISVGYSNTTILVDIGARRCERKREHSESQTQWSIQLFTPIAFVLGWDERERDIERDRERERRRWSFL